jgi:hypothetical protein
LASGSSIDDSSSSAARSFTNRSSAFTASVEKSSSAPSTTAARSTSASQKTRPDHVLAQEAKEWDEMFSMSWEDIKRQGWDLEPGTWSAPHFNRRIAC